ncbi:MAG: nucleotidyltransferase family protein [Bacteroidota bacterium]
MAAGLGKRLGFLTASVPKPLLEVHGKPVLLHNIELCRKYGIDELFINTHYRADKVKDFFGDGKKFGVSITYSYEPELLGTAGALNNFKANLPDSPFFVIYADNISDFNLRAIYDYHQREKAIATVALFEKRNVSLSGIAVLGEQGRIIQFIEKPAPEQEISRLVNAGIYVLSPKIFEYIPFGFSDFGTDVFPRLISSGEGLYGVVMRGKLEAIDTIELYDEMRKNDEAQR